MGRLLIEAVGSPRPAALPALALGALAALLLLAARPAPAAVNEFDASADVLAVGSDGQRSFLDGGLGELRYDEHNEGLQLDNLRFGYRGIFADIVHVTVEAVSYEDRPSVPLDLTQAFVEVRPFPRGPWRSRLKVGAFYAPISMENRLQGWRSAYSLTPSAINTWVGEELRTFGAEYDLDWLGRQRGHDWELGVGASLFGWNESAGELLQERGWAMHDRQATLFGRIGSATSETIDEERLLTAAGAARAGYYVDGSAKYLDTLELRALHYDNRADPNAYSDAANNWPWHTHFDSTGIRWTPSAHWTLISQWLAGSTCSNVEYFFDCWNFAAEFVLASWQRGADRLTARYDRFDMDQTPAPIAGAFSYNDHGHAFTVAYEREINRHLSLALEVLQINSSLTSRLELGEPAGATERQLELAVRLQL
ncbi:MAG TPA: hypothetical protein VIX87_07100 [Steroidobacteraceae bacterium]